MTHAGSQRGTCSHCHGIVAGWNVSSGASARGIPSFLLYCLQALFPRPTNSQVGDLHLAATLNRPSTGCAQLPSPCHWLVLWALPAHTWEDRCGWGWMVAGNHLLPLLHQMMKASWTHHGCGIHQNVSHPESQMSCYSLPLYSRHCLSPVMLLYNHICFDCMIITRFTDVAARKEHKF